MEMKGGEPKSLANENRHWNWFTMDTDYNGLFPVFMDGPKEIYVPVS